MERGNTKHGPIHDEQLAHETEGLVRGQAHRAHAEEWREPEPVEDAVPSPSRRSPDDDTERDEEIDERNALARVTTRDFFPANRDKLLTRLADSDVPESLLDKVAALPAGDRYASTHEVMEALGINSPETDIR
jgi:hypothetical protein